MVQRDTRWVHDPVRRRAIGGVYSAFLLPALMGLFAQLGGTDDPLVWRLGFVIVSVVGAVASLRLLVTDSVPGVTSVRAAAAGIYLMVATIGAFPELDHVLGLRAIQAEALLLVLLVALGHALVWRFLVRESSEEQLPND